MPERRLPVYLYIHNFWMISPFSIFSGDHQMVLLLIQDRDYQKNQTQCPEEFGLEARYSLSGMDTTTYAFQAAKSFKQEMVAFFHSLQF